MDRPVEALIRFSRLLATAPSADEARALLLDAVVDLTAAAAVLVQVGPDGASSVAGQRGVDFPVMKLDALDDTLGTKLVEASGGRFTTSAKLPLVADGGLYGVLALLFEESATVDDDNLRLAGALVDLTATMLARTKELEDLERAYEELRASRRALGQAEKLRAVGGVAAGIVHDLKNVFTPLLLIVDALATDTSLSAGDMREQCEELVRPLKHGLTIVERLRQFSRFGREQGAELAELHTIVDDAVSLCRPRAAQIKTAVHFEVSASPETPIVRVEVAEVLAAVTNLIVNAIDAIADTGGTVIIKTTSAMNGGAVEVIDHGPGVPAELRERIFEPFFTTKGKDGTGLGLAMVRDLAQRHGGRLTLVDVPGGGAHFTLWFPEAVPT